MDKRTKLKKYLIEKNIKHLHEISIEHYLDMAHEFFPYESTKQFLESLREEWKCAATYSERKRIEEMIKNLIPLLIYEIEELLKVRDAHI